MFDFGVWCTCLNLISSCCLVGLYWNNVFFCVCVVLCLVLRLGCFVWLAWLTCLIILDNYFGCGLFVLVLVGWMNCLLLVVWLIYLCWLIWVCWLVSFVVVWMFVIYYLFMLTCWELDTWGWKFDWLYLIVLLSIDAVHIVVFVPCFITGWLDVLFCCCLVVIFCLCYVVCYLCILLFYLFVLFLVLCGAYK